MPNINPQLEAALTGFARQPGITPDQAAQLRTTITQDTQLLNRLNADAVSGQLRGFQLQPMPPQPNLVGRYDMASGTITLPADSFGAGSANLPATLRVQHMSMAFAHANPQVTQEMVGNLQDTLNGSPVLAEQVRRAVTPPEPGKPALLEHFAPLNDPHAGGTYNGNTRTMSLPLTSLTRQGPGAQFSPRDLTFVLSHETEYS